MSWGYGPVVKHLSSMREALSSVLSAGGGLGYINMLPE